MSEERDRKTINVLETYFSDANLNFDKLLKKYIQENHEGFVPIAKLISLKKFKELQATAEDIVKATEASTRLNLNSDKTSVARVKPFVAFKKQELDNWSVYVEGLWRPYNNKDKISELFSRLIGHVSFIRFPPDRNNQEHFHGYCFIEFSEKEDVAKAIELLDCSKGQNHSDPEVMKLCLKVISKIEYNELEKEYLEIQKAAREKVQHAWEEYNKEQSENLEEPMDTDEKEGKGYPEGLIVFVTNLAPKTSKTIITKLLQQADVEIAYVDYKRNAPSCHVRLKSSDDADKLVNYFSENKKTQQDGKDAEGQPAGEGEVSQALGVRKITGAEEKIFWENEGSAAMDLLSQQASTS
ncbi:hypothetical protein BDA99DRAFT_495173 [Phascolomyces articulosus]|uniref:Uncharacterized protein n=1 Tax=Phascolomyces articulosus TaxID=60185 RepID=A0AAD5PLQ9_9FUNG|nr:hypothetical protein BDA99DRAFT_495173 [Phascolomyces articulosus]